MECLRRKTLGSCFCFPLEVAVHGIVIRLAGTSAADVDVVVIVVVGVAVRDACSWVAFR